jgi:3-isopropylmalate dehydrogenase
MLLDHVGRSVAGGRVEAAVAADLAERGSSARRTTEICDAVAGRLT